MSRKETPGDDRRRLHPQRAGRGGSRSSDREARLRGTDLVVVNTTRGDRLVDPRYAHPAQAEALEGKLAASGVEHQVRRFTSDDLAAGDVLGVAADVSAELLVIGLRDRSPVGKLIMGSTAQRILLDAACPVLAVKVPARPR